MPVILVDRLPLPSLKTYTVISVALLSCSVYYAVQVTNEANWKTNTTVTHGTLVTAPIGKTEEPLFASVLPEAAPDLVHAQLPPLSKTKPPLSTLIAEVVTYMVQEPLCIWVSKHLILRSFPLKP